MGKAQVVIDTETNISKFIAKFPLPESLSPTLKNEGAANFARDFAQHVKGHFVDILICCAYPPDYYKSAVAMVRWLEGGDPLEPLKDWEPEQKKVKDHYKDILKGNPTGFHKNLLKTIKSLEVPDDIRELFKTLYGCAFLLFLHYLRDEKISVPQQTYKLYAKNTAIELLKETLPANKTNSIQNAYRL